MEVLAGMVTASATSSPLQDDGEMGVGGSDVDDLADTINRTRLGGDMTDTRPRKTIDDLGRLLSIWNTSGNAEALDGQTLQTHLLP